ncbi:MAG: hypothetical protein WCA15_01765 [Candidatus Acidiferrales bacterium]
MATFVQCSDHDRPHRSTKAVLGICEVLAIVLSLAVLALAQNSAKSLPYQPLVLTAEIPLPGVHGRLDHFAFDSAEPGRLFLAALGNDSLEIINLTGGARVRTITGLGHPQGVVFAPGLNKIFVASRDHQKLYIYDGAAYRLITTIDYQADVDNLRYDAAAKRVYVDYGDGEKAAIGMVDAMTNQRLPDEYKTGSHAESFQLAEKGPEMYVNLPQLNQIAVVNRDTHAISRWPVAWKENFPMALDEADRRVFIGFRIPPRFAVFDMSSGKMVGALPCVADTDDLYYDSELKRIYVPGGQGFISVFQMKDPDHYELIANVPSALGGRTAGYPRQPGKKGGPAHLFVAIPERTGHSAEILSYVPVPSE